MKEWFKYEFGYVNVDAEIQVHEQVYVDVEL
jgi:hypothetical protein